jgi:exosortase K
MLASLLVNCLPGAELQLFAQGAARIASLFTGAPTLETAHGWVLPLPHQPILISSACSGTTFFISTCALLCWHNARRTEHYMISILIAFAAALLVSIGINALRIICLVQAHRWIIPQMPESYANFAHMVIGIAVFLPTLIALNALLEFHGHSPQNTSSRSA